MTCSMSFATLRRLAGALTVSVLACLALASTADASEIVGRNVYSPKLQVDENGTALVTFKVAGGGLRHVLYWGAVDWADDFSRDYSGGWKSKRADWKHFHNVCGPYTGPELPLEVAACTMPDGSHWALQKWARLWANYGGHTAPTELHVSHWTGDLAILDIHTDWGYHGMWRHLWGTFEYHGKAGLRAQAHPDGRPARQAGPQRLRGLPQGRHLAARELVPDARLQRARELLLPVQPPRRPGRQRRHLPRHGDRTGRDADRAYLVRPSGRLRRGGRRAGQRGPARAFGGDSRCKIN